MYIYVYIYHIVRLIVTSEKKTFQLNEILCIPDSKVHGANMGPTSPTWVVSALDGPHIGPMNLAIRVSILCTCSIGTFPEDIDPTWASVTVWKMILGGNILGSEVYGTNMGLIYGADRTQVGPMLAPWTLFFGLLGWKLDTPWHGYLGVSLHICKKNRQKTKWLAEQ